MKKVLTIVMALSIWIGAFANHEKATIIIKTSSQDQLEVKVDGIEQRSNQQQYVLQNLDEGKHLVTINKIVQSGYNQPTKKQLVYKGNVTAYKGMSTTYHLDRNVMRTGEKVAIPIPQSANQHGPNNGHQNGWNNGHHPSHGNGYNNGYGHNGGHGSGHNNGHQCNSQYNHGNQHPQHQCNNQCSNGHHYYNNGYNNGHQNHCTHYVNYGHCNNAQCGYSGCQSSYNGGSWYNGYQHYNGYNNQNYNYNNWNNGYNYQGYNNGSGYNNPQYNNGYYNNNPNYNNYGNYNGNSPWNNGYKQPISNADFKKIMDRIQDQFTDKSKVDLIKLAFNQQVVSAQQVRAVIEELTFESNKLEVAKLLHPQTINPQDYYLVSDAFTFSTNKKALSDFIMQ